MSHGDTMGRVALLDYGMGNLRSVARAVEHVGGDVEIVSAAGEVAKFDRVILPGVGAFADAARHLRETGMGDAVAAHIDAGRPMLGVCLGLQLLFDTGHEDGTHQGTGILAGEVVRFGVDQTHGLKVPHMGWNALHFDRPDCPLLAGLEPGCHVYFVHAYHAVPTDPSVVMASATHGIDFTAAVWRDNVVATQFHPEKSQAVGLRMFENFLRM
ncbi:MAG: imidazole glycerol phosphate synthase subunit HisH [Planctomycetota bacterium]